MRPRPRQHFRSLARRRPLRRGPSRSSGRSVLPLASSRRSPGSGSRAAPHISRRTSSRQPSPGGSADTARSGASPLPPVWYLRRAVKQRQQHEDGSDSPEGRCGVARLSRSACKPGGSPSEAGQGRALRVSGRSSLRPATYRDCLISESVDAERTGSTSPGSVRRRVHSHRRALGTRDTVKPPGRPFYGHLHQEKERARCGRWRERRGFRRRPVSGNHDPQPLVTRAVGSRPARRTSRFRPRRTAA